MFETEDESSIPANSGRLSTSQLVKFLAAVKSQRNPKAIAVKYTQDIPALIAQLKPLRSSPLVQNSMQHRICKLIKQLEQ